MEWTFIIFCLTIILVQDYDIQKLCLLHIFHLLTLSNIAWFSTISTSDFGMLRTFNTNVKVHKETNDYALLNSKITYGPVIFRFFFFFPFLVAIYNFKSCTWKQSKLPLFTWLWFKHCFFSSIYIWALKILKTTWVVIYNLLI